MNTRNTVRATGEATFGDRAKSLPFYVLPHHAISRLVHAATRWRTPWWKNLLTRWFARQYEVDLSEAREPDLGAYSDFNAFFTRALRPDARPLPEDVDAVVSPADGTVSAIGPIDGGTLVQAKGHTFTVTELLGGDETLASRFHGGQFATVYLSPSDYHRVHIPASGRLREMIHIPGRLFGVAGFSVRAVNRLFARNERVAALFDTARGPMAVVMVGAINVSSIETVWSGVVTPPRGRRVRRWFYRGNDARSFRRGDEIGRFNLGSTVITLFGPEQIEWSPEIDARQKVRMGQALGRYAGSESSNVVQLDAYLKSRSQ
jgi:phosphatidylserine decarboxylase